MRLRCLVLACLAMSGCASPASVATPSPSPIMIPSGALSLPTEEPFVVPSGAVEACAGIGLNAVIRGDPADHRVTWLVSRDTGARIDIVWPAHYWARFVPHLEVIDSSGDVVIREGDPVSGVCDTAQEHIFLVTPPFK